jgi:hypothetical protein
MHWFAASGGAMGMWYVPDGRLEPDPSSESGTVHGGVLGVMPLPIRQI